MIAGLRLKQLRALSWHACVVCFVVAEVALARTSHFFVDVGALSNFRDEGANLRTRRNSASRNVTLWNARCHIVSRADGWCLPRRRPCRHTW